MLGIYTPCQGFWKSKPLPYWININYKSEIFEVEISQIPLLSHVYAPKVILDTGCHITNSL